MPKALNADRELLKALFVSGFTPTQISRKTGVNANTVSTWSKRGGWTALRSKACEALALPGERLAALTIAERSAHVRDCLAQDLAISADTLTQTPVEADLEHLGKRADVNQRLAASSAKVFGWGDKVAADEWGDLHELEQANVIDVESVPSRQ